MSTHFFSVEPLFDSIVSTTLRRIAVIEREADIFEKI